MDGIDLGPWMSVTGQPLQLGHPDGFIGNCSAISSYQKLNGLGEGTYGIVYRARDRRDQKVVALKLVRILPAERHNGIPITALREISILRSLRHPNIVNVLDVAVGEKTLDELYMVMEYCEQDLANLFDELGVVFNLAEVKCLSKQLLEGLEYIHHNGIIHRDVKLQNILLTSKGVLKLADFGMARPYSPRPLTPGVVTIWYRAPELLLGTKNYTPSVDLWSAGLIIGELLLSMPCLPGETELGQLALIVALLGTPSGSDLEALSALGCPNLIRWRKEAAQSARMKTLENRFLNASSHGTVKFLDRLLRWNPRARPTASNALGKGKNEMAVDARFWWNEEPEPAYMASIPVFPEIRNEQQLQNSPQDLARLKTRTKRSRASFESAKIRTDREGHPDEAGVPFGGQTLTSRSHPGP